MSRILIWKNFKKEVGSNIFEKTQYKNLLEDVRKTYPTGTLNWGNKVWIQGIISELDVADNEITYYQNQTVEEINCNFDMIIFPRANCFAREYRDGMDEITDSFKGIKIPVYIIACGVQADSYEDLENLINDIGDPSKRFIEMIYKTGGEFALRGYFSKEFFNRLGFSSAVVTGCPSLYQLGRNFKIVNKPRGSIKPVFNGSIKALAPVLKKYPKSIFIDQGTYFEMLYNPQYTLQSLKQYIQFAMNYGLYTANMLKDHRIKTIADVNEWRNFLIEEEFNFSFGQRIHGNIMAILSGIPATVVAIDSRTREMAEFFDIPFITVKNNRGVITEKQFEMAYTKADYTHFNDNFTTRYDKFQDFLRSHKIVSSINEENHFFHQNKCKKEFERHLNSSEFFDDLYRNVKQRSGIASLGATILEWKMKATAKLK